MQSLRKEYVQQLHKGHPGADAAMERTRDVVYGPSMTSDIDSAIASVSRAIVPNHTSKENHLLLIRSQTSRGYL